MVGISFEGEGKNKNLMILKYDEIILDIGKKQLKKFMM